MSAETTPAEAVPAESAAAEPVAAAAPPASAEAKAPLIAPAELKLRLEKVVTELVEVLETETSLLRQVKTDRLGPLVETKSQLARTYELLMGMVKNDPDLLRALPESDRETLKGLAARLDKAVAENRLWVKQAQEVNARICAMIQEAVLTRDEARTSYTRRGYAGAGYGAPRVTSVLVDRSF